MPPPSVNRDLNLARAEGFDLYSAMDAILKGVLESEIPVHRIAAPRGEPFGGVLERVKDRDVARVLTTHACTTQSMPDGVRAAVAAQQSARSGRGAVALVPAPDVEPALAALRDGHGGPRRSGALCLILENRAGTPGDPARAAAEAGLPIVEPDDLNAVRDGIEDALRLSRIAERATAMIVHDSLLHAADTLEARPNRVVSSVDVAAAMRRRRRGPRTESRDLLRMARRLELNAYEGLPSPGERAGLGLLTVGAARLPVRHLLYEFQLSGRVPVLHLGLINPLDEVVVTRLLERCEHVVVFESRPGSAGSAIAMVAEAMRRRDERPGMVWVDRLPPDADGVEQVLEADDALNPSTLARKAIHLLHAVRPGLGAAERLAPSDPDLASARLPRRRAAAGAELAESFVRAQLDELQRWLDERPDDEEEHEPTVLAVDGIEPDGAPRRVMPVELFDRRRFWRAGVSAVRQASRSDGPRLLIVCDMGDGDDPDPERLARSVVPAGSADRVQIVVASLADRLAFREVLRSAADRDQVTVVVARDGPPYLYDSGRLEQSFVEIDRLGFQPTQRIVWPAELACDLRPVLPRDPADPQQERSPTRFEHRVRVDRLGSRAGNAWRLRFRPLLEQVVVVRTRPPAPAEPIDLNARLTPPRPVHASAGQWRAHLAGWRGASPGVAAIAVSEAGRRMGYRVGTMVAPEVVGAGRRAWAQVLFTRPGDGESPAPIATRIPYGEADLLLGIDPIETIRATGPDPGLRVAGPARTYAVVNSQLLEDQLDAGLEPRAAMVRAAVERTCRIDAGDALEFAGACRSFFLTDRMLDLVLVGAAFQRGLVPVTVEAFEGALRDLEEQGFGRCREAFRLGRRLVAEPRLLGRRGETREWTAEQSLRQTMLDLGRGRGRRRRRRLLETFGPVLRETVSALEDLDRTEEGRRTRRDLVLAMRRCLLWGGPDYARRYGELVQRLHAADGPATGGELTRCSVLPLADAMLPRDLIYLATMSTDLEQKRRIRRRLGVRLARGDEMERRFLNRLEVMGFGRRIRLEFRASDWPARLVALFGRWVPPRWRASAQERGLRTYVIDLVERAAAGVESAPRHWATVMERLAAQAEQSRLRGMEVAALRSIVEGRAEPTPEAAGAQEATETSSVEP